MIERGVSIRSGSGFVCHLRFDSDSDYWADGTLKCKL